VSIKKNNIYQYVNKNTAAAGLVIVVAALSTAAILVRKAQESMPSLAIAANRVVLATIFLLPFSIRKVIQEKAAINNQSLKLMAAAGMLLGLNFALWIKSLEYTDVISSTVLLTTSPVWVTLLSPFILKERIPRMFIIGLGIALCGILMISSGNILFFGSQGLELRWGNLLSGERVWLGNLLALGGAWCSSGYMLIGRKGRQQFSTQTYVFIVYTAAAVTLVLLCLFARQPLFQYSTKNFVWIVLLALVPQIIGHSLLNWALGRMPAAVVSLSLLGQPLGSAILAFFVLAEKPTLLEFFGAAVILFGIYWANRPGGTAEMSEVNP
jgi:drug/metabolite transporter (DMT)-like permease